MASLRVRCVSLAILCLPRNHWVFTSTGTTSLAILLTNQSVHTILWFFNNGIVWHNNHNNNNDSWLLTNVDSIHYCGKWHAASRLYVVILSSFSLCRHFPLLFVAQHDGDNNYRDQIFFYYHKRTIVYALVLELFFPFFFSRIANKKSEWNNAFTVGTVQYYI